MALTSATINITSVSATSITVTGGNASGGSGSYTYQWMRSTDGGSTYSNLSGATTAASVIDGSVVNNVGYYYLLKVTDTSTSAVTVSNNDYAIATTLNTSPTENTIGGVYNSVLPVVPSGGTATLQMDASGRLITDTIVSPAELPTTGFVSVITLVANTAQQVPSNVINNGAFLQNNSGATVYISYNNTVGITDYQVLNQAQFPFLTGNTNAFWLYSVAGGQVNIIGA